MIEVLDIIKKVILGGVEHQDDHYVMLLIIIIVNYQIIQMLRKHIQSAKMDILQIDNILIDVFQMDRKMVLNLYMEVLHVIVVIC